MTGRLWLVIGLVALFVTGRSSVRGDDRLEPVPAPRVRVEVAPVGPPRIPFESLPPALRESIRGVMERPALTSSGLPETVQADPRVYRWLLDHPDMTVKMWKQLGARVSEIADRGDGVYVYQDTQGSEVHWHTAYKGPGLHLWFAEGKVKPAALLPLTSFHAVGIMQFHETVDQAGKPVIRHQVHFQVRCDSKTVSLAARILGASAPRLAEQYLGQLQMFYGGLAWYLCQDEERAKKLYRQIGLVVP